MSTRNVLNIITNMLRALQINAAEPFTVINRGYNYFKKGHITQASVELVWS